MHGRLITKRSPITLIWKFMIIEASGLVLYLIASALGDTKYYLYTSLFLIKILPYMTARIIFLLGAQFLMIIYAFLSWYYEEYIVEASSVVHIKGVIKRVKKEFEIDRLIKIKIKSGTLGKLFHYGSIRISKEDSFFELKYISRPERVADVLIHGFAEAELSKESDIEKLLKREEDDRLEFKSSLRFDYKAGGINRGLEKAAMKSVSAFLNSKGGHLIIGVSDRREPLGLENDYQSLQRKDRDGFENHFTQSFNSIIGPEFRNFIRLRFYDTNSGDICAVQVAPSARPAYFKADNTEHFYMRTGNITTSLKLSEMESYLRARWPKR